MDDRWLHVYVAFAEQEEWGHPDALRNSVDAAYPWDAEVDGARWRIRLNGFPDEIMYTLIVDGKEARAFHDWPERWRRA
jgi:hypothetical protein